MIIKIYFRAQNKQEMSNEHPKIVKCLHRKPIKELFWYQSFSIFHQILLYLYSVVPILTSVKIHFARFLLKIEKKHELVNNISQFILLLLPMKVKANIITYAM